jgi:2,3-bisphosphoglycerate-dependent phosphoglycerate mutase
MKKLVLIRHGESLWNMENRFTGWTDVDLSPKGIEEARKGGIALRENKYEFDLAYTSVLKRAIRTLWVVMDELDQMWIPVKRNWRLNERHYGALQGLNKIEMVNQYGDEQVHKWRRGFAIQPPPLTSNDSRYCGNEPKYASLDKKDVPLTESLKDTIARLMPLWENEITADVKAGKRVLIAAHGNSLRAIVKVLDKMSDDEIVELNIPTGIPLVYELEDNLEPIRHYYLGDEEEISKAINSVANQSKAKK